MNQFDVTMFKVIASQYEHLVKSGRSDLLPVWGKWYEAYKAAEKGLDVRVYDTAGAS